MSVLPANATNSIGSTMLPHSDKLADYLHYFFTTYLPGHKSVSPHTVATYKQAFLQLLRFYHRRFPQDSHPDLARFEVPLLLDFLSYLEQDRGNTSSTRNLRLAALKSFFQMVALLDPQYHRQCRQIRMIPKKRAPRWPLDALDKHEVDAIFSAVDPGSREGYRDLCILRTLYNTGARASELCSIRLGDLHFSDKRVLLYGKGGKVRLIEPGGTRTLGLDLSDHACAPLGVTSVDNDKRAVSSEFDRQHPSESSC